MKYYLIVGEASGDLHASHLMRAIKIHDSDAQFRFFGGDMMLSEGGVLVRHYRQMAYMGFIPVLLHMPTILRNMSFCKQDIVKWQPDVVILVDYAGFNLSIAKYLRQHTSIPVCYYILPKLWAWKEYRIKNLKRDVDHLFSIMPFEVDFFQQKHHLPVHYVGNPTADEVRDFLDGYSESHEEFCMKHRLSPQKPLVALLAGSRRQEIKDNLPSMLMSAKELLKEGREVEFVLAKAPSLDDSVYAPYLRDYDFVKTVSNSTYPLLVNASAALVTSGTATLETALFRVPQVVCYKVPLPHLADILFRHIIKCKFISLVNLFVGREIVPELFGSRFSISSISSHLKSILPGGSRRQQMLSDYDDLLSAIGNLPAADNAAKMIVSP